MQEFKPPLGVDIAQACVQFVNTAVCSGEIMYMNFNGITLYHTLGVDASGLVAQYHQICEEQVAAYRKTPEYAERERKHEEWASKANAARAGGILTFSIKDQEEWNRLVSVNQDPYGAYAVRYAARWANYMEKELTAGKTIAEAAKKCSHAANLEGITGFMHGAARYMLCKVWEHGDALKVWQEQLTKEKTNV